MVYVSSVGPVDPETGQIVGTGVKEQARQCLTNLQAKLEDAGQLARQGRVGELGAQGPDRLRHLQRGVGRAGSRASTPVGQGTLMPPLQRRAGFRVSLGVIAQA